jgi:hypothetical protein
LLDDLSIFARICWIPRPATTTNNASAIRPDRRKTRAPGMMNLRNWFTAGIETNPRSMVRMESNNVTTKEEIKTLLIPEFNFLIK